MPTDTGAYDTNGDRIADFTVIYPRLKNQERHIMKPPMAMPSQVL